MQFVFGEAAQHAEVIRRRVREDENDEESRLFLQSYHIEQLPAFAPQKWRGAIGHLRWRKACNILKRFSLLKITGIDQEESLSLHPLVHEWAKERQDPGVRQQAWISTVCVLGLACGGFRYTPIFRTLQSHVRSCLGQDVQDHLSKMPRLAAWQVSFQLAQMLLRTHEDRTAVLLLQSMQGLIQMEDENSLLLMATQYLFALYNLQTRKIGEAIRLLAHIKKVEDSRRLETHPFRLDLAQMLARAYSMNGQTAEALKMLEHVVQIKKSTLDKADVSLLASQHDLAAVYRANGRIAEAVKMLEHVVQIMISTLDEADVSLLVAQHELAATYRANGRVAEAVKMLEHVVQIMVSTLDEADVSLLVAQHELAAAYRANGRIAEAVKMLEHVVPIKKSKLEEANPSLLSSQHELALAYTANGHSQRAMTILDQVVRTSELTFGINHPETELCRKSLQYAQASSLK